MKHLIILCISLIALVAKAEMKQLPEVTIDSSSMGGHVILIDMKAYLIISGKETEELNTELGTENVNNLTKDMVMGKNLPDLVRKYYNGNRPTTRIIIDRYSSLKLEIAKKEFKP